MSVYAQGLVVSELFALGVSQADLIVYMRVTEAPLLNM